ncbi:MAG: iron-containing alcohol dehydrogenase, partial [Bacillota bacterium]
STWISVGVPGDWAAHKLGHALTLYYGIDHGKTMGIIYPALMKVMKEPKHAKLLQYAERVWDITGLPEDDAIDEAIAKTADFFESLGVPTHLSAYNIGAEAVSAVADNLRHNELTAIGENGIVTIEHVIKIMKAAL